MMEVNSICYVVIALQLVVICIVLIALENPEHVSLLDFHVSEA